MHIFFKLHKNTYRHSYARAHKHTNRVHNHTDITVFVCRGRVGGFPPQTSAIGTRAEVAVTWPRARETLRCTPLAAFPQTPASPFWESIGYFKKLTQWLYWRCKQNSIVPFCMTARVSACLLACLAANMLALEWSDVRSWDVFSMNWFCVQSWRHVSFCMHACAPKHTHTHARAHAIVSDCRGKRYC